MKACYNLLFVLISLALLAIAGCGSGSTNNRVLQSLSVSPASVTAQGGQAQFMATGQFNTSPMMVNPASVNWVQVPAGLDPPFGYDLTTQPFTAQCFTGGTTFTIVAIAPVDANAPSSGVVPTPVFLDLVSGKATEEGGFVASTAQMICP
jgi:hypothetical protein